MENTELTDHLLESYRSVGGINHLDGKNLPSRQAIGRITSDLLRLDKPSLLFEWLLATPPASHVKDNRRAGGIRNTTGQGRTLDEREYFPAMVDTPRQPVVGSPPQSARRLPLDPPGIRGLRRLSPTH